MQRWLELRWVKRDNTVLPHQVAPDTAATASNPGGSAQDITEDLRTEHVDNGPQVDPCKESSICALGKMLIKV
jgi:hypothetical protein